MRLLILASILCLALGHQTTENKIFEQVKNHLKQLVRSIPKDVIQQMEKETQLQDGTIQADVSDYADQILSNLKHIMISNGLDPTQMPNATLDLLITGYIELSNGWLSDFSTISRSDEVIASYSSTTKKFVLDLPIEFHDFQFTYDYHTHVTLINIYGEVLGQVEDVTAHVVLSFDFNTYTAHLDTFDIMETGTITIHFTGNGLVDWITNAMTSVLTTFLHPLILSIVQGVIKSLLDNVVEAVNKMIDEILHRT